MKEIFLKHKIIIFRTVGFIMLLVGVAIFFWVAPKEVVSENEVAAANIARMEASVSGGSGDAKRAPESSATKFVEELKDAQTTQIRYMTILTMLFGAGFLVYSFISKPKSDSER